MALDVGNFADFDEPDARCGTDRDIRAAVLLRADFAEIVARPTASA